MLASAAAGAVAGGLVSFFGAVIIADRGERGRLRATGRVEVRRAVDAYASQLLQAGLRRGAGNAEDLAAVRPYVQVDAARSILDAAEHLGRLQRWRLRRAAVNLFGQLHVRMAEDLPRTDPVRDARSSTLWMCQELQEHPRAMDREGAVARAQARPQDDDAWEGVSRALDRLRRVVRV